MKDLTVIFLTLNKTPEKWARYHLNVLLEAVGDYPIITVSREPMSIGKNLIDTDPPSYSNIYKQILRACKEVETDYIAVAEDDVLYCKDHFNFFRPKADEVAYNMNKWSLYVWNPMFSNKMRKTNAALIAPKLYLIDALEERFSHAKDGILLSAGEVGRENVDKWNKSSPRKAVEVYSPTPIIQLSHPAGTEERQKIMRKSLGPIKAIEIPYWGRAEEIIKHYG